MATFESVEYAKIDTRDYNVYDAGLTVKFAPFSYTHTGGAGTHDVNLCKLPPGKVRIIPDLCRVVASQMVATADLHIGTRAFVNEDGTAVVEDNNRFADNLDAGGGAIDQTFPLPSTGAPWHDLDSKEGITVYADVDTANIEDTDTIHGYVAFTVLD